MLTETQPSQVLQTVRSPALETCRDGSPPKPCCSWKHPLHCFVPCVFFICVAFCAWTPSSYSVKGNAAFHKGSFKKLCELFSVACPAARQCSTCGFIPLCLFLRVSVVTQLQLQPHWGNQTIKNDKILVLVCPEFLGDPRLDPWQTYAGTAPSKFPEMCWLVPAVEPGPGSFLLSLKLTSLPLPQSHKISITQNGLRQSE